MQRPLISKFLPIDLEVWHQQTEIALPTRAAQKLESVPKTAGAVSNFMCFTLCTDPIYALLRL